MSVGVLWMACIAGGFFVLLRHDTESGNPVDAAQVALAANAAISPDLLNELTPADGQLHIVVALHPKCPCSLTTISELEELLGDDPEGTHCTFLVNLPKSETVAWMDTATMRAALRIPNVVAIMDADSIKAGQLGLHRSGESILINSEGEISFRGGITAGRSCRMENPGARAVKSLIQRSASKVSVTPTFGCELGRR